MSSTQALLSTREYCTQIENWQIMSTRTYFLSRVTEYMLYSVLACPVQETKSRQSTKVCVLTIQLPTHYLCLFIRRVLSTDAHLALAWNEEGGATKRGVKYSSRFGLCFLSCTARLSFTASF